MGGDVFTGARIAVHTYIDALLFIPACSSPKRYLTGVIGIGSLGLQRYPSNKLDLTVYKIHQTLHFPDRDILCNNVSGSLLAYQGVVPHSQATSNWTPDSPLNNSSCISHLTSTALQLVTGRWLVSCVR